MNPFGLLRMIRDIYDFCNRAHDATTSIDFVYKDIPEEYREEMKIVCQQVLDSMKLGVGILLLGMPLLAAGYRMVTEGISIQQAGGVIVMCSLFFPFTIMLGVGWGFSIAVIRAPNWFLDSSFGEEWKEMIGIQSTKGAKAFCYVMVLVGFAGAGFVFWLGQTMKL